MESTVTTRYKFSIQFSPLEITQKNSCQTVVEYIKPILNEFPIHTDCSIINSVYNSLEWYLFNHFLMTRFRWVFSFLFRFPWYRFAVIHMIRNDSQFFFRHETSWKTNCKKYKILNGRPFVALYTVENNNNNRNL